VPRRDVRVDVLAERDLARKVSDAERVLSEDAKEDDEDAKRMAATLIRDVGLIRSTPVPCGSPGSWNRSFYSWANSHTSVKAVRSSRTASSDLEICARPAA
jgi:hypothetical protein